jgi:fibronectin type 3 domain-containing protein
MNTKKIAISFLSALVFGSTVAFAAGIPENVSGLKASAVDATSIGLNWKAAKDGEGTAVKNYRLYYGAVSVLEAGVGDYEKQADTPNNNTTFVVTGLKPNTKYYFAATAISTDNKESAEYSLEASASTKAEESAPAAEGGVDLVSPTVASVSAPDKQHVKMTFSEAVQLPLVSPEASFGIVEQINPANELTVKSAVLDPADTAKKTILLETSDQKASMNYIVTAGVAIKDAAGNPIVSGGSDSGLFLGSAVEPVKAAAPAPEAPVATTPVAVDCAKDLSCLLTHMADCTLASVTQADEAATTEYKIEVTGAEDANCKVKYTATKHTNVLFAGSSMDCKVAKGPYATMEDFNKAVDTKNCAGTLVDGYKALAVAAAKDTTPPENITNLLLSFKKDLEKFVVMMSWTPSLNTAKDLVDQLLYMSLDKGKNYDTGKSLGALVSKTEVPNLDAGKEYAFKITTRDSSGNESTGVVKSIRLPQTGAGVGLLLLASLGAAKRLLKRKKQDII